MNKQEYLKTNPYPCDLVFFNQNRQADLFTSDEFIAMRPNETDVRYWNSNPSNAAFSLVNGYVGGV